MTLVDKENTILILFLNYIRNWILWTYTHTSILFIMNIKTHGTKTEKDVNEIVVLIKCINAYNWHIMLRLLILEEMATQSQILPLENPIAEGLDGLYNELSWTQLSDCVYACKGLNV